MEYEPTPAEIAAGCERIRREWSRREERKRSRGHGDHRRLAIEADHWQPPIIHVDPAVAAELNLNLPT